MKTVESFTEGHPDKVCDQIADALLDAYLAHDSASRVKIEAFGSHGAVMIGGEVRASAEIDVAAIAQKTYRDIGYGEDMEVFANIEAPALELAQLQDAGLPSGECVVYGYATSETAEYLPKPLVLANALASRLASLRRNSADCSWMRPDGKVQVTYDKGKVVAVALAVQHDPSVSRSDIEAGLTRRLLEPVLGDLTGIDIAVNGAGTFVRGGFDAATGMTGRKTSADTYGCIVPNGTALSGKDPSRAERSGAYMARFAAKNIVANGLAKNCLVSVAYVAGREQPVMLRAASGDGKDLTAEVRRRFDFRPGAIVERLDLRRPIYKQTAVYGHFGRDQFPWEHIALS